MKKLLTTVFFTVAALIVFFVLRGKKHGKN